MNIRIWMYFIPPLFTGIVGLCCIHKHFRSKFTVHTSVGYTTISYVMHAWLDMDLHLTLMKSCSAWWIFGAPIQQSSYNIKSTGVWLHGKAPTRLHHQIQADEYSTFYFNSQTIIYHFSCNSGQTKITLFNPAPRADTLVAMATLQ